MVNGEQNNMVRVFCENTAYARFGVLVFRVFRVLSVFGVFWCLGFRVCRVFWGFRVDDILEKG